MAYQLCEKMRELTPYDPIEGEYRVRLDANESYFVPDEGLRKELAEAAASVAFNRYPDPYAKELCGAFAALYGLPEAAVTAGNGSDELISLICGSLLQKGDRLLTLAPDFSMYRFYGEIFENPVDVLEKEADLSIDVDKVIRYVRENGVRAVLFSNPCNPTGRGLPREEVRRLVSGVEALVVLDEAYMDFWDQSLLPEVLNYDNLIILKTCSKAMGMAALRVGFAVAGPVLTRALRAAKSPYNVNSVSQAMGACVLKKRELLEGCRNALVRSARELWEGLSALAERFSVLEEVYPTCTNFVFLRSARAKEIHRALLERSVAVRCFDGFLRITTGSPEENRTLLEALGDILIEMGGTPHAGC